MALTSSDPVFPVPPWRFLPLWISTHPKAVLLHLGRIAYGSSRCMRPQQHISQGGMFRPSQYALSCLAQAMKSGNSRGLFTKLFAPRS